MEHKFLNIIGIVAVIAAAIAMAESDFGNNVKFRVVSFKRK